MSDALDVREFVAGYLAEAEEHLSAASANLVSIDEALRRAEKNPRAVRDLFRNLHTLKGLSAMVGAEPIVNLAHEMETLLRSADRAGGVLPAAAIDAVSRGVRAIDERLASLSKGETLAPAPQALLDTLASLHVEAGDHKSSGTLSLDPEIVAKLSLAEKEQLLQGLAKGRRGLRVDFVPSEARAADGLNITRVRERIGRIGEIVKVLPRSIPGAEGRPGRVAFLLLILTDADDGVIAEAAAADPAEIQVIRVEGRRDDEDDEPTSEPGQLQRRNFVRVDVGRLDDALERLSSLVVTRSRLQRALRNLANSTGTLREVMTIVDENGRQLRDLRGSIMRARMVPVAELLDRTPLLVRGLARTSGKQVRLSIDAGNSELDKAVADRLFGAIVHLLRNAVDHAIETPEERRRLGKSEEASIQVVCFDRADGRLELTIADDGRGVDRKKVAERAGTDVPQDDTELLALLTRPGLSTLDKATHTSGRGMGMDIVKRIVTEELGGELTIRTTANVGTRFSLVVPLSVAIIDVFSFRCGDRTFVVPVNAVDELAEVEPKQVSEPPDPHREHANVRFLKHRGSTLPFFALRSLLGLPAASREHSKVIIVRRNAEAFAFEVDAMIGQQDVVVRPLVDPLAEAEGVAGSTDLGDGQPTLVLDLLALLRRSTTAPARTGHKGEPS